MTDLIPVVPYEDIRAAHDWLVKVLGFSKDEAKAIISEARQRAARLAERV